MPGPALKTIGSYEVEREIGRGGMGVVLLARQPALDRAVVLKSLRRECADDPQLAARFEREAQAAGSIQHQNVVAVHDCFGWRGRSYICQEYIDGIDLAAALGQVRVGPRIAGLIALELTRGLVFSGTLQMLVYQPVPGVAYDSVVALEYDTTFKRSIG